MINNHILIVDDEEEICSFIKKALDKEDIDSNSCCSAEDALKYLLKNHYDLILLDYRLPGMDGFQLIERLKEKSLIEHTEIILMTAFGDMDMGMNAIKKGCADYIAKPFNIDNLIFRTKKVLENILYREQIKALSQPATTGFEDIIGKSKEIRDIFKIINHVADKDVTVLIEGETGTGKELIARAIHTNSHKKDNIFIPVNCGALNENLLASELFGHEKGAFTGAVNKKFGIMETANNGTVFLDEINTSSINIQTKLLRFIETGEFLRVGGNKVIKCNTRIITASNQNIHRLVNEKKFREDLYHRLNIVRIELPTLRERKDDIEILTNHFIDMFNKKFSKKVKINKNALKQLTEYAWPGNIRQLKNTLQSIVLLNENGTIRSEDLPDMIISSEKKINFSLKPFKDTKDRVINDFENDYLRRLLIETVGNVSKAARISKMNRKHLIDKLKIYNIDPLRFKN